MAFIAASQIHAANSRIFVTRPVPTVDDKYTKYCLDSNNENSLVLLASRRVNLQHCMSCKAFTEDI